MCEIMRSGYYKKQDTAFRIMRGDERKCLCILRKRITTVEDVHFPGGHFVWQGVARNKETFQIVWIEPCSEETVDGVQGRGDRGAEEQVPLFTEEIE